MLTLARGGAGVRARPLAREPARVRACARAGGTRSQTGDPTSRSRECRSPPPPPPPALAREIGDVEPRRLAPAREAGDHRADEGAFRTRAPLTPSGGARARARTRPREADAATTTDHHHPARPPRMPPDGRPAPGPYRQTPPTTTAGRLAASPCGGARAQPRSPAGRRARPRPRAQKKTEEPRRAPRLSHNTLARGRTPEGAQATVQPPGAAAVAVRVGSIAMPLAAANSRSAT